MAVQVKSKCSCQPSSTFTVTPLVSNQEGLAPVTDPNLTNAWGLARSPTSAWQVANNHSGTSTVYNSSGEIQPLVINIPPPAGSPPGAVGAPTGVVFNPTNTFLIGGNPATFIFATEDGTIVGWNAQAGSNGVILVDNSPAGSVYKGIALVTNARGSFLLVTDFHNAFVEVYDSSFNLVTKFTDPQLSAGTGCNTRKYAPFGIQTIPGVSGESHSDRNGDRVYITFALQTADAHDDVKGPGHGFVDYISTASIGIPDARQGQQIKIKRFASRGPLNSPWGIAKAPCGFGDYGNLLLIGNFGDGAINVYSPYSCGEKKDKCNKDKGTWVAHLVDCNFNAIVIDGLWEIAFGNDNANSGPETTLFFAAGPNAEANGLFGTVTSN
jgi:uncharacterized protein (TIGR03118 family)